MQNTAAISIIFRCRTVSNLTETSPVQEGLIAPAGEDTHQEDPDERSSEGEESDTENIPPMPSSSQKLKTPSKRSFRPSQTSEVLAYLKERDDQKRVRQASTMDEVEAFFYSMAATTKKLPLQLQSQVKLKVCQVVAEAEMSQHDPQMHVQIPTSTPHEATCSNSDLEGGLHFYAM